MDNTPDDDPEPLAPAHWNRHWIDEDRSPLPVLYDEEGYPFFDFAPVPQVRHRRYGWDADKQRLFVALLARCPSVTRAARACGMSARSVYKLLDKPGAEEFAKAWDAAQAHGMERLRIRSLERSLQFGDFVPIYRRGKLVRIEHRANDRLAIALLGDHQRVAGPTLTMQNRWRSRQEWASLDKERAAEQEAEARAREDQARMVEEYLTANRPKPRLPRIVVL